MSKFVKTLLMASLALLMLATAAVAQGPHPAYVHAISDLRTARAHLEGTTGIPQGDLSQRHAIDEITAAIREIKDAAVDDGKPLSAQPPPDVQWTGTDRLHRAAELLDAAYADIDQHETNDFARDLKHRALHHIQEARKAVHHILQDKWHE